MNGALPPSSMEVFLTVSAHCAISTLPTSVDPVKVSLRTIVLLVISPPIARALLPATTLKAPAGMPARSPRAASASAHSGVSVAGFNTTVQPAASAGATLRVIIAMGKFHGVIAATTPIGCLSVTMRWLGLLALMVSP